MSVDKHNVYMDLISGHFDGTLNTEEREALNQALVDDEACADLFAKAAALHNRLHVQAKDNQAAIPEVIEFPTAARNQVPKMLAVAAALLVCVVGLVLMQLPSQQDLRVHIVRGQIELDGQTYQQGLRLEAGQDIQTAANSVAQIHYPDGSVVTLDAKSQAHVADQQSLSLLAGSITCEINKRSKANRFVVKTSTAEINVIGTAFTVSNRNQTTNVHVVHGVVEVATEHQTQAIALKASDSLRVSDSFLATTADQSSASQVLWSVDFEQDTFGDTLISGALVANTLAPDGNTSDFCGAAEVQVNGDGSLLQFTLKNSTDTYFNAADDAYITFRYWAESCGWLGVWMAAVPEQHYLHYHREFIPLTNRWVTARIRLSDCVRGQSKDSNETMSPGTPVHWFMIQAGNLPGARVFIDDIKVQVPANK